MPTGKYSLNDLAADNTAAPSSTGKYSAADIEGSGTTVQPQGPKSVLDKAGDFASGFDKSVLSAPFAGLGDQWKKAGDSYANGHYLDAATHAIEGLVPVVGPTVDAAVDAVTSPLETYRKLNAAANQDHDYRTNLYGQAENDFGKGNYGQSALHFVEGTVPFVGPKVDQAVQAAQGGNYEPAGNLAGNIFAAVEGPRLPTALAENYGAIKSVAPKLTEAAENGSQSILQKLNPTDPHSLVMGAVRPTQNAVQFKSSLSRAMPDIKAAEAQLGKPIESLDDLIGDGEGSVGAIQMAKAANRKQFRTLFPGAQHEADLSPVADAVAGTITRKMALENPQAAQKLLDTANKYKGKFSLEDIGGLLQDTNAELESYYSKNPAARKAAAANNPDIAADVAKANALRKVMYDMLDAPGQGEAARELQKRWGALNDVENAAMLRRNVMLRAAPENLAQQLSKIDAAKKIAMGGLKMGTGRFGAGALDMAQAIAGSKAADYLKEFNSTNGSLKRAFKGYGETPSKINMPERPYTGPERQISPGRNIYNMPGVEPEFDSMGEKPLGDTSGPVPFEMQRNPGYHTPNLTPKQRLLTAQAMSHTPYNELGSAHGEATDFSSGKD